MPGEAQGFFLSITAAKAALAKLTRLPIHRQFSGYLAAVRAEAERPPGSKLRVNFSQFFNDYLLVGGAPKDRPYLLPFVDGRGQASLFNRNVAGSYAPSSLRDVAPIRMVLDIQGRSTQVVHDLIAGHESLALDSLGGGQKIPIDSLAVFLFRDHLIPRTDTSAIECVFDKFLEVFGYDIEDAESRLRFETLYMRDRETFSGLLIDSES